MTLWRMDIQVGNMEKGKHPCVKYTICVQSAEKGTLIGYVFGSTSSVENRKHFELYLAPFRTALLLSAMQGPTARLRLTRAHSESKVYLSQVAPISRPT